MSADRPRLTASILTRDAASRLEARISEAAEFADEVIVGVDADSSDATLEIASELADITYRFRHPDHFSPARLLPFDYASGDWILSLDDDESMEASFDQIRDELLANGSATHYYFPRKAIVNVSPAEYARSSICFPDWQLRLFRNEAALVWKPPRAHSGYQVQGCGYFEERASVLHFEALWCDDEKRRAKLDFYRRMGVAEGQPEYVSKFDFPRAPAVLRPTAKRRLPPPTRQVHSEVRQLLLAQYPGWKAELEMVSFPTVVSRGAPIVAELIAHNTGTMAWLPACGRWPILNLGFHLLTSDGAILNDGPRFALPRPVRPSESVSFVLSFAAPADAGAYRLEWDMVSELECWFQDCGGQTLPVSLEVR